MPVMNGYEATAIIRSLPGGDTVKIVALTASAFKEQRSDILATGCDDVVLKPYQLHKIFDAMAKHLGVRFRYAEPAEEAEGPDAVPAGGIASLRRLPTDMLEQLSQSAKELDTDAVMALVEEVADHNAELADVFRGYVRSLDFDLLIEALKTITQGNNEDG